MADNATAGSHHRDVAQAGPVISAEVLQAVAALGAELERILGPRAVLQRHQIHNVNDLEEEQLSLGDRIADWFAGAVGSWRFIIIQSVILIAWIVLNVVGWFQHWDPYPFILLNLALSFQAAYTAPIIMMSQNRQSLKDRIRAEEDFLINQIAEDEIRAIMARLDRQDQILLHILERVERSDGLDRHDRKEDLMRPLATGRPESDSGGGLAAELRGSATAS
jgi:uncharacterized membrane protein